jgi:hypothetical protein
MALRNGGSFEGFTNVGHWAFSCLSTTKLGFACTPIIGMRFPARTWSHAFFYFLI